MKAGGSRYPASEETVRNNWHTITQDGPAVFKAAVSNMANVSEEMMQRHHLTAQDIRYLVPHQANLRIIDATAKRMGLGREKCMINIDRNGNTTAATIPLCLYEYEAALCKGDNLILASFGGGYTGFHLCKMGLRRRKLLIFQTKYFKRCPTKVGHRLLFSLCRDQIIV